MTESEFWIAIEKSAKANNDNDIADRMTALLATLPVEEILDFHSKFAMYMDKSDRDDLWGAALLMNGGYCSDDCFHHFRCWLITKGQEVFERAVEDPDSLASQQPEFEDGIPITEAEAFCYATQRAYEEVTGKDIYDVAEPISPIDHIRAEGDFDWEKYTNTLLASRFPKLWELYGEIKQRTDELDQQNKVVDFSESEVDIPGIGNIKVGDVLVHVSGEKGVVRALSKIGMGNAIIEFKHGSENIVLTPVYLSKEKSADKKI